MLSHRLWRCKNQRLFRSRNCMWGRDGFSSRMGLPNPDERRKPNARMAQPTSCQVVLSIPRSDHIEVEGDNRLPKFLMDLGTESCRAAGEESTPPSNIVRSRRGDYRGGGNKVGKNPPKPLVYTAKDTRLPQPSTVAGNRTGPGTS